MAIAEAFLAPDKRAEHDPADAELLYNTMRDLERTLGFAVKLNGSLIDAGQLDLQQALAEGYRKFVTEVRRFANETDSVIATLQGDDANTTDVIDDTDAQRQQER